MNRALFTNMLDATSHIHMNSWFQKPAHKKVTRKDDPSHDSPPYTPEEYTKLTISLPAEESEIVYKTFTQNGLSGPIGSFSSYCRIAPKALERRRRPNCYIAR